MVMSPSGFRVLSSDCPNDGKSCPSLSPRQQQTPTPTTDTSGSASTTFDFWWPFPLATTTTTTPSGSTTTTPASSSQAQASSNSTTLVTSVQSSSASLANSPSQSVTSPSLSLPISNTSKPASNINIIDAVPFISAAGIILSGLAIWLIYGCCTRRPRIRTRTGRDDGELVCGPPYRNDDGDGEYGIHHRDVEERGRARAQNEGLNQENELMIPKRGQTRKSHRKSSRDYSGSASGQYRWPSYNEPPRFGFDSSAGFYIPDEYKELEGDSDFLSATLLAPPPPREVVNRGNGGSKSKLSRASRTKGSGVGLSSTRSEISERERDADATSVALLSLYESACESVEEGKAKVPWESLRHKSIKRGILEQVHKEERWMDSVRSSITRAAARGSALHESVSAKNHEHEREEEGGEEVVGMGKRGGHIDLRADSDSDSDSDCVRGPGPADARTRTRTRTQPIASNDILTAGPSGYEPLPHTHTHNTSYTTNEAVSVHPITDHSQTPAAGHGVRHSVVQLKDDPQDLDRYTPIPARTTPSRGESRSRSRGRGRSRGPNRHSKHDGSDSATASPVKRSSFHEEKNTISRDVLPSSPPQLMSPPLESQICFTPPLSYRPNAAVFSPPSSFSLLGPAQVQVRPTTTTTTKASRSRADGNHSPTKIPTPRKSRKLHSSTPPRLPFPGSGGRGGGTGTVTPGPRPDAYRGRLLKKQKSTTKGAGGGPPDDADVGGGETECDEAMRKVDKIIQSGWGARDVVA